MRKQRLGVAALLAVMAMGCGENAERTLTGLDGAAPRMNQAVSVFVCCGTTLYYGSTGVVYADAYDGAGQRISNPLVTWWSSNPSVATAHGISDLGTIVTNGVGYATIYATVDGVTGSTSVQVRAVPIVTSVTVSPSPVSVQVGSSRQLTAQAYDQLGNLMSGKTATWTTGNSGVASVSSTGVLQGVTVGSTTVHATIDGVTANATVTVQPHFSVSISGPEWINTPGNHQWTASVSGGSGNPTYQWYIEAYGPPQALGTGSTQTLQVDANTETGFILTVHATSGSQVASNSIYVCNLIASMAC